MYCRYRLILEICDGTHYATVLEREVTAIDGVETAVGIEDELCAIELHKLSISELMVLTRLCAESTENNNKILEFWRGHH